MKPKMQPMVSLALFLAAALCCAVPQSAWSIPPGLLFHLSFDKLNTKADFAAGDPEPTEEINLEIRSVEGVKGAGLLQKHGERCSYQVPGNLDASQGSYSVWVKPLNWDGHSGKFRHFLTITGVDNYRMLLYLYPIGDEAVINYIQINAKTPEEATWRAGAPVDILQQGKWTHLVSTWDAHSVRVYANGKRVGEGLVSSPLPKADTGLFTVCPIEFWKHPRWSDPEEQTICDEVRVFDRALTDDEVLDLYAAEAPGGLVNLQPTLSLEMKPDYFAKSISVTVRPAHLDAAWKARLKQGAQITLIVREPRGVELASQTGPPPEAPVALAVPDWVDGDYTAEAALAAEGQRLTATATLTKPPTPWLPPEKDWRADRVLEPWTPLEREGHAIRYWNGQVSLPGALPAQITSRDGELLAAPIRLEAGEAASWDAPQVIEEEAYRVTVKGGGSLGQLSATYETLMEFDGLIRADLTLTPPAAGVEIDSLALEIPLRADVAQYYRNPTCQDWDGGDLAEETFIPYAWLGTQERGLSWFMESTENWRIGEGQPAMTIHREGEAVTVRLHLISEPTRVTRALTYTVGFEATPVRPVDPHMYDLRFASGPQVKGVNMFVYGWGPQISYLNGRLIAQDPEGQRALIDGWRAKGMETRSYTCTQCTANISPEYRFFAEEWNQPYGASFSGYKRVGDNAPYSMVPVCPRSSFADFLVWCVKEHVRNDWGGGIYTDIDGAKPCDNRAHGCGFTDVFGRSGRTWPLYAHRGLSRRIYAACHDAGKSYLAHAHSNWYSLFNAFNDGWCPGEQYSSKVLGKPSFYMDDIPDRVWRTEFCTPTTGVTTFLLPQLGRLAGKEALQDPGPSECCWAAAMCYGAPLWAGSVTRQVTEDVWAAQMDFGMADVEFVPFWRQGEFVASEPQVRISLWRKPGKRLVVVTNWGDEDQRVQMRRAAGGSPQFRAAWKAEDLSVNNGVASFTLPAKRGALVMVTGLE